MELTLRVATYSPESKRKKKPKAKKQARSARRTEKTRRVETPADADAALEVEAPRVPPAIAAIEEALRAWRLQEARRLGIPAFRIFSDQTLRAIAQRRPQTAAELLAIPGIGMNSVEKYGRQIYRVLGERRGL